MAAPKPLPLLKLRGSMPKISLAGAISSKGLTRFERWSRRNFKKLSQRLEAKKYCTPLSRLGSQVSIMIKNEKKTREKNGKSISLTASLNRK